MSEPASKSRLIADKEYAKAMLADAILSGEVTVSVKAIRIGKQQPKRKYKMEDSLKWYLDGR